MNNQMIYELVNAGCDLRKLSPEFLEKLCGVYESHTSTATTVSVDRKATKAEAIEALQEVMMGNDVSTSIKFIINNLIEDMDSGCTMENRIIRSRLGDLSKISLNGLPMALRMVREALS